MRRAASAESRATLLPDRSGEVFSGLPANEAQAGSSKDFDYTLYIIRLATGLGPFLSSARQAFARPGYRLQRSFQDSRSDYSLYWEKEAGHCS
jgi:hypothetical protein